MRNRKLDSVKIFQLFLDKYIRTGEFIYVTGRRLYTDQPNEQNINLAANSVSIHNLLKACLFSMYSRGLVPNYSQI